MPTLAPRFVSLDRRPAGTPCSSSVDDFGRYRIAGRTVDDAAGEAFDKVARLLGLGYPGGPAIDRIAAAGDAARRAAARAPCLERDDFSFSGLKTAVVALRHERTRNSPVADIAAGVPGRRRRRARHEAAASG